MPKHVRRTMILQPLDEKDIKVIKEHHDMIKGVLDNMKYGEYN